MREPGGKMFDITKADSMGYVNQYGLSRKVRFSEPILQNYRTESMPDKRIYFTL